jgi:hypothetical protein
MIEGISLLMDQQNQYGKNGYNYKKQPISSMQFPSTFK